MLTIARAGAAAGCTEALFTLGDKPELRYRAAREALAALGHETTISYLREMCALVLKETGLLPHVNPGIMTREEIASLREVSASQGIMLESSSERLCEPGGVHYGSPDKAPAVRLETMRLAGELAVPFTTGILIGIGETRAERLESLVAIRDLHARHGHIQEVIVQNFRAKPDTKRATAPEPDLDDLLWTHRRGAADPAGRCARAGAAEPLARRLPEADRRGHRRLGRRVAGDPGSRESRGAVAADRGAGAAHGRDGQGAGAAPAGVSGLCVRRRTAGARRTIATRVRRAIDAEGWARDDDWAPGLTVLPQPRAPMLATVDPSVGDAVAKAVSGARLDEAEIVRLFAARDADYEHVITAADALRQAVSGDAVRYVVNRNINYTNICYYRCKFCAFSKGKTHEALRGTPYDLAMEEVVRRSREAWDRGATEVCLQGGIHPDYTGATYLGICRAIKAALPDMHVHAFSPLEVTQGAATLGLSLRDFLAQLKEAGLGTLPGTAAEILDDEVRAIICPDKVNTAQWLDVVRTAHGSGCAPRPPSCTAMSSARCHWARHLLVLRDLQAETGGFTEFVPLPFVHMEAPMYLRGQARKGPTLREAVLMHAVARLALHPLITNIQTSWVKMGPEGAALCLNAGANDLGGTLMNESISRAAGTQHGQEFPPEAMEAADPLDRANAGAARHAVSAGRGGTARGVVQCAGAGAGGADAAAQDGHGGIRRIKVSTALLDGRPRVLTVRGGPMVETVCQILPRS